MNRTEQAMLEWREDVEGLRLEVVLTADTLRCTRESPRALEALAKMYGLAVTRLIQERARAWWERNP